MWLAIFASDDAPAAWACEGLRRRGLEPLEIIYTGMLAHAIRWEHRLENGFARTELTLPGGRTLRSEAVRGVLNRLTHVPDASLLLVHPSDRHYVAHELQAFFLSWLHALPAPVWNRPTPFGLSGRMRHISEWVWLASQAGLPHAEYRQSSRDAPRTWQTHERFAGGLPVTTVVVAGGAVTGAEAPPHIRAGCLRMSQLSATPLLSLDFVISPDQAWNFAGVSTRPDLRIGGEPLLDALASALRGQSSEES